MCTTPVKYSHSIPLLNPPRLPLGEKLQLFTVRIKNQGIEGPIKFVKRKYAEFYQLHIDLISAFPDEAGVSDESSRVIPELPAQAVVITDDVAEARVAELDLYCQRLYTLPDKISKSDIAQKFLVDAIKQRRVERTNNIALAQQRMQSRRPPGTRLPDGTIYGALPGVAESAAEGAPPADGAPAADGAAPADGAKPYVFFFFFFFYIFFLYECVAVGCFVVLLYSPHTPLPPLF